jgi:hypothetical protein
MRDVDHWSSFLLGLGLGALLGAALVIGLAGGP